MLWPVEQAAALGLALPGKPRPDPAAILARIRAVAQGWSAQQTEVLNNLGIEIISGVATFEEAGQVTVKQNEGETGTRFRADVVIIATGSTPFFPPNLKPDGHRVLAPRFASHLESLPEDIIVIGAGATGSEFTYLFNRLGVNVTWIVDPNGVLPAFAPAAGHFLTDMLVRRKLPGHTLAAEKAHRRCSQTQLHRAQTHTNSWGRVACGNQDVLPSLAAYVNPSRAAARVGGAVGPEVVRGGVASAHVLETNQGGWTGPRAALRP